MPIRAVALAVLPFGRPDQLTLKYSTAPYVAEVAIADTVTKQRNNFFSVLL